MYLLQLGVRLLLEVRGKFLNKRHGVLRELTSVPPDNVVLSIRLHNINNMTTEYSNLEFFRSPFVSLSQDSIPFFFQNLEQQNNLELLLMLAAVPNQILDKRSPAYACHTRLALKT